MYLEDSASAHLGDYCKATGEGGLIQLREMFFRDNHMTRVPIYGCGTPERAPPDQQFRVLKLAAYNQAKELSMMQRDLSRRPEGATRR